MEFSLKAHVFLLSDLSVWSSTLLFGIEKDVRTFKVVQSGTIKNISGNHEDQQEAYGVHVVPLF